VQQPDGLIAVLEDSTARTDERDDAAMDLGDYDEPSALEALLSVAHDPSTPGIVLASAGESIARILLRSQRMTVAGVDDLLPAAHAEFTATMNATLG